jgi:hypothetical protein
MTDSPTTTKEGHKGCICVILHLKYVFMIHEYTGSYIGILVKDPTVTVKCRITIKALFLYFNLCLKCNVR